MTTSTRAQCVTCALYIAATRDRGRFFAGGGPTCAAFPTGIPDEIYQNFYDHREPYVGDGGIRWTMKEDREPFPVESFLPERLHVGKPGGKIGPQTTPAGPAS